MAASLLCVMTGSVAVTLSAPAFTLSWTHSVEKTEWRETWAATKHGLEAVEARVKGGGAGMEPPPDARLTDGWLVYVPRLPPQDRLTFPDSGFTEPLTLCIADSCKPLRGWLPATAPERKPVVLTPGDCRPG